MKKLILSLFILSLIVFQSCKDEEVASTDTLLSNLTASKAAYESAADGDWIAITEAEYNALAANLSSVSKSGTEDDLFADTDYHQVNDNSTTWSNNNSATMSSGSYLFAFKYKRGTNDATTEASVKVSTSGRYTGLDDFGNDLPSHAGAKTHYFVIKNSNTPIESGKTGYLAMYFPDSAVYWYKGDTDLDIAMQYNNDRSNTTPNSSNGILLYQGLSSTTKQW